MFELRMIDARAERDYEDEWRAVIHASVDVILERCVGIDCPAVSEGSTDTPRDVTILILISYWYCDILIRTIASLQWIDPNWLQDDIGRSELRCPRLFEHLTVYTESLLRQALCATPIEKSAEQKSSIPITMLHSFIQSTSRSHG
jgi:hypothetical protein